mmetsp:Transcript_19000/g.32707  ORF Transcript_19000/g.32707 Transcript_19000/m.32707 type:complete len:349 (+) Transcript_19000:523-1569(+)
MGRGRVGTSRKRDRHGGAGGLEGDVEVGEEGGEGAGGPDGELKRRAELGVGDLHGLHVEHLENGGRAQCAVGGVGVDLGLGQEVALHARHVEAVHLVPEPQRIVLGVGSNGEHEHSREVGHHGASRGEEAVAGNEDAVEHALVEEEVAHPLGHNHLHVVDGQVDLLDLAADAGDDVLECVEGDHLLRDLDDVAAVHGVHMPRPGPRGEHAEDAGAAADVEDELVAEDGGVVEDVALVAARAHVVPQHLLVDLHPRVRPKVPRVPLRCWSRLGMKGGWRRLRGLRRVGGVGEGGALDEVAQLGQLFSQCSNSSTKHLRFFFSFIALRRPGRASGAIGTLEFFLRRLAGI